MRLAFPRKNTVIYRSFYKDFFKGLFSKRFYEDKLVTEFENKFAEFIGSKYAIGVSSARWGLYLILQSLGLRSEDEVLVPAITHSSIPLMVQEAGAIPVFVDVCTGSFDFAIEELERKISGKTRVIIATHLYGIACDIKRILEIAGRKKIIVLEDCAHGIGVKVSDKMAGNFGKASIFSFDTTKFINTLGGGMIVTNDFVLYQSIRQKVSDYSFPNRLEMLKKFLRFCVHRLYTNRLFFTLTLFPCFRLLDNFNIDIITTYKKHRKINLVSYKTRYAGIQALLGIKQLDKIEDKIKKVNQNINLLRNAITSPLVTFIKIRQDTQSVQYLCTLLVKGKEAAKKYLLKNGIDGEEQILEICHGLFNGQEGFINSKQVSEDALQISIHANLNEDDITHIADVINQMPSLYNPVQ